MKEFTIRVYADGASVEDAEPILTLATDDRKYGRSMSLLGAENGLTVVVTKEATPKTIKFAGV